MWKKDKEEGVSAVIAVILMVAITVVLAGVLYVWVMGMANTGESGGVTIGLAGKGKSGGNYTWEVASVQGGSAKITDVVIKVKDSGGAVSVSDDYSSATQHTYTNYDRYYTSTSTILDNDKDGFLTQGDVISTGSASTGNTLEIYVGGNKACSVNVS